MPIPEYLICVECETPCYVFEWEEGKAKDIVCETCGNDEPDLFATPDDFDSMMGGGWEGERGQ